MKKSTNIESKPQVRAPEPTVDRIEELAARILSGDILLPKFQRDFVWEKSQIIDLLDSIFNNYPVGSVLLWRSRQELKSERNIADLDIAPTKQDYPVNYLLDGQQRLSTICGALYWRGRDPRSKWNVAFDLRDKRFVHLESLDAPPVHRIRLNRIPDAAAYFQQIAFLEKEEDGQQLAEDARALFNRFKDYKIATVTLHDMSIEAVAPIFERINSKGTPLTIVDLMRAATWSEDFDLVDQISSITDELDEKQFGGVERKTILRSISAAAGGGFSESSIDQLRRHESDRLIAAVNATKSAYQRAVDFLVTELHIPSDRQLPYVNQVVVLGEVFRLLTNPTPVQTEAIKRWFWRTAIAGYFGGWNTGNMAADQAAAKEFAQGVVAEIEASTSAPPAAIWRQREFRSNSAHSKILILLLAFNQPRDLLTGARIDVGRALFHGNAREYHHFFPRDFLKHRGVGARQANSLANFVMLSSASNKIITNRAPSDYLQQVISNAGEGLRDLLQSNLISEEAFEAALNDDYNSFLILRSETVQAEALRLAQW
ncbi:DUF262 domain-containing protein [Chelativorans sp. ZYF759]|uniref:GmrSD restriction endonuclease domain-containing protein n=1 Tax=Chelativorans sp. ZYF759 TaxID=2692213 RepID=UPI00145E2F66|nr:DUF262 domain-containing protein [Chelativorans sp. ZYF759]NMG40379.1 DUF262 domain-containing protein [Chelativorans sp. ZYF759]